MTDEKEMEKKHQEIIEVLKTYGLYSLDEITEWLEWYYQQRKKKD